MRRNADLSEQSRVFANARELTCLSSLCRSALGLDDGVLTWP